MILVLADLVNICDSLHVSWDTIIQVVPTDVDDRWTNPTATPCHPLIILLLVGLTGKPRNRNTRATFPVRLLLLIPTSHQNPFHHPRQTTHAWMLGTRDALVARNHCVWEPKRTRINLERVHMGSWKGGKQKVEMEIGFCDPYTHFG